MICRYSHCKHENKEVSKEEGIKSGNGYWHRDCYEESKAIRDTMDLFQKKCNPLVVMPQLRRTINNIVYDKKQDARLLLFGVKYYVSHNIPLNYPGGLYYVLQNKNVQDEWKKIISKQMKVEFHCNAKEDIQNQEEDINTEFTYKDTNKSKFSEVLGKA